MNPQVLLNPKRSLEFKMGCFRWGQGGEDDKIHRYLSYNQVFEDYNHMIVTSLP